MCHNPLKWNLIAKSGRILAPLHGPFLLSGCTNGVRAKGLTIVQSLPYKKCINFLRNLAEVQQTDTSVCCILPITKSITAFVYCRIQVCPHRTILST